MRTSAPGFVSVFVFVDDVLHLVACFFYAVEAGYELGGFAVLSEAFKACGFRPDEIARRKLETITEALNEGWRPETTSLITPRVAVITSSTTAAGVPWASVPLQAAATLAANSFFVISGMGLEFFY